MIIWRRQNENKEEAFQKEREAIEQEAHRKYLAADTEPDGSMHLQCQSELKQINAALT